LEGYFDAAYSQTPKSDFKNIANKIKEVRDKWLKENEEEE